MCYNCGCHIPDDEMGHPDNITNKTFEKIGKKVGKTEAEAKEWVLKYLQAQNSGSKEFYDKNIEGMFLAASRAWGQSIPDAKKEVLNMLKTKV